MKKVLLINSQGSCGIGDIICSLPFIHKAKDLYPEYDITYNTTSKPAVIPIFVKHTINQKDIKHNKAVDISPSRCQSTNHHYIEALHNAFGLPFKKVDINIPVPLNDVRFVDKLNLSPNFVSIAIGNANSSPNSFPIEARQAVINSFIKMGVPVVGVSGREGKTYNGVICYKWFSLTQNLEIINRSMLYVGPDSGTTWLSMAVKVPIKICLLDENRFRRSKVGYQNYVNDDKIIDITIQKGVDYIIYRCLEALNCGKIML